MNRIVRALFALFFVRTVSENEIASIIDKQLGIR